MTSTGDNYLHLAQQKMEETTTLAKRGKFEEALAGFEISIRYLEQGEFQNDPIWYKYQSEYGYLLNKIGKKEHARSVLELCLTFWNDNSSDYSLRYRLRTLYELIKIQSHNTPISRRDVHFEKLQTLVYETHHREFTENYLNLANAYKYRNSTRLEHKIEALVIYRYLTTVNFDIELKIDVLLSIIELLALEYRITRSDPALKEILGYLDQFYYLGKETENFYIVVNYMIMNSRIELAELNFKAAKELLDNAMAICKEHDLRYLRELVAQEIETLTETIMNWRTSIEMNSQSIAELRESTIEKYIDELLNKRSNSSTSN